MVPAYVISPVEAVGKFEMSLSTFLTTLPLSDYTTMDGVPSLWPTASARLNPV